MDRRGLLEKLFRHGWIINIYLLMYDIVTVNLSYLLALWIRFDCHYRAIPMEYLDPWKDFIPIYMVFSLITFAWQKNLLFNCSKLMVASYENVADIRERVAKVITTYKQ